ncbi:Lysophospholipid acyltransferase [Conglomerata obtusa]
MIEISESEKYYLLSLLAIFLSSLYISLYKQKILHIPTSLAILFIAFDFTSVLILIGITVTSFIGLLIFYKNKYTAHALMTFNMISIMIYKMKYKNLSLDICAPLMLFTIKYYYLGKEFKSNKNIKESLIYLFLVPGILTGPVPSYSDYLKKERVKKINRGLIYIFNSLFYLFLYSTLRERFDVDTILSLDNVFLRIVFTIILGTLTKCKYYFVWTFAHGCFLLVGIDGMKNVFPMRAEFSTSVKQLQSSWNVFTNAWLKDSIFLPLKSYGFFKASFATFFVSALWHGTDLCYFLMFLTFSISVPLLNNMNAIFYKIFNYRIAYLFATLQMTLFVSFFMIPFYLLDYKKTLEVWRSVYFYGYCVLGFSLLFYLTCKVKKIKT